MKIELPDEGSNVIQIEILRKSKFERKLSNECQHSKVILDHLAANLKCADCGTELNPIGWIQFMAEEWHRVRHLYERTNKALEDLHELKKSKCKCKHCGRFTEIYTQLELRRVT